jgi:hypothetical protein
MALISQLYRSNPTLNEVGFQILENWYKQTSEQKTDHLKWLADQLRKSGALSGKQVAVGLAHRLGVEISDDFPPPKLKGRGKN